MSAAETQAHTVSDQVFDGNIEFQVELTLSLLIRGVIDTPGCIGDGLCTLQKGFLDECC